MGWMLAVALVVGFPTFVVLESLRQQRRIGRPSGRPNLIGLGALELERHLTPERKVEHVLLDARREERTEPGYRPALPGDLVLTAIARAQQEQSEQRRAALTR
jgi:hypothetical protein